jgi:hypothetical protein
MERVKMSLINGVMERELVVRKTWRGTTDVGLVGIEDVRLNKAYGLKIHGKGISY